jgi:hypothetical protein
MMIYLLEGETVAGYNPFTLPQLILTTLLAVITFVVGLILYSKSCWKNNNKN